MTFLKKLGTILASVLGIVSGVAPGLLASLAGSSSKAAAVATTATNDLTAIGSVIVSLETALQGKTGAAKLQAAIPLVANIIKTSEMVAGHKIANEALFTQGCTEAAQAAVDILNSLDSSGISSTGQSVPQVAAIAQQAGAAVEAQTTKKA